MAHTTSRLLATLGAHPGDLTQLHLQALVAGRVCESYDLDFKGEMYGSSDASKRDLATDVAALANTAGGVILIGVVEDERSQATSLQSVAIGDAEVRRLRQIVANAVAPIPDFDIGLVPDAEGASRGFVVISVARSLAAPHAVAVNEGWRYPRRNGSTTRYLSEPEVAQAYRDRLAGLSSRRDRLERVWDQGVESLDSDESVWVAVALVPDVPGAMTQDGPAWRRWDSSVRGRRMTLVGQSNSSIIRTRVGQGCFSADGGSGKARSAQWVAMRTHADGAGFYAKVIGRTRAEQGRSWTTAYDENLAIGILSGLSILASNAQEDAGVAGTVAFRVGLLGCSAATPVSLGYDRGRFGIGETYGEDPIEVNPEPFDWTLDVEALAEPGPSLVAAAAIADHSIGQAFGVPELGQFTRDGRVRISYCRRDEHPALKRWADSVGVEVTGDLVE